MTPFRPVPALFYAQPCSVSRDREFAYAIKFFELYEQYGRDVLADINFQAPRCEVIIFSRLTDIIVGAFLELQNILLLKKAVKYGDNCFLSWKNDAARAEQVKQS